VIFPQIVRKTLWKSLSKAREAHALQEVMRSALRVVRNHKALLYNTLRFSRVISFISPGCISGTFHSPLRQQGLQARAGNLLAVAREHSGVV
jgi:hypothetical protein